MRQPRMIDSHAGTIQKGSCPRVPLLLFDHGSCGPQTWRDKDSQMELLDFTPKQVEAKVRLYLGGGRRDVGSGRE